MKTKETYTDKECEKYFKYLDELRESGETNMFGARPFLMKKFPMLEKEQAGNILARWMRTFSERHKEKT